MTRFRDRGPALAGALFAAFAVLTVLVIAEWVQPIDEWWDELMRSAEVPWLVSVAEFFHHAGAFPIALGTTVVVAVAFLVARKWWVAGAWVAMVAIAEILSVTTKALVGRERPGEAFVHETSAAYPSGHSMVSGAAMGIGLMVLLAMLWPHRARLFLWIGGVYAVLMAWSRTYLHAHWMTDVVGGLLFGTAVVLVVAAYFEPKATPRDD
ncbi:MAG: phosphatase PAP2 family protein [Actinomycetota bacterium]